MSATNCDCACPDPTVTEVPGAAGEAGAAGADGTNGVNCYTLLTADAIFADAVATVQVSVALNSAFVVGQTVFAADPSPGTDHGTFEVISLTGTTVIGLRATDAPGDTALPYTIGSGGKLTPTGATGALAGALPAALTDSTGVVTPSTTLAAGIGNYVIPINLQLSDLTNNIIAVITPGHAFRILKVDWANNKAGGAAGAAVITPTVSNGTLAGGVITLGGTTTVGAVTAGTAVTQTIANGSSSVATITLTASGVTTYTSGDGSILVYVQNLDTLNAVASLNSSIDDIIAALP